MGTGSSSSQGVPNFETPVDADTMNDYDIRVKVKDNGIPGSRGASNQLDDTVSVVVNVQDVNEAPARVSLGTSAGPGRDHWVVSTASVMLVVLLFVVGEPPQGEVQHLGEAAGKVLLPASRPAVPPRP